jgi:hypothetical protein
MSSELNEIRTRINAALDIMPTEMAADRIRAHLEWEAREMLWHVPPDKMTPSELAALIAVLHSAHARVLTAPVGGKPILRIVPTELQTAQFSESIG